MFGKNLTSKVSKNKTFLEFRVFEYALWQKTKTRKCWKSTEDFLNQNRLEKLGQHFESCVLNAQNA